MKYRIWEKLERQRHILKTQWENFRAKERRQLYAIEVSTDYAETWRLKALCEQCYHKIEPPLLAKRGAKAGAKQCDDCGVLNY